ncbi:MAG: FixH family protein [Acidobacteriota bacterium]
MTWRWNWGSAVAVVYATFAVATTGVVWFAVEHPVDLVSSDYYQQSLTYDERIAAIERGDALGTSVGVVEDDAGVLTVRLPPEQARVARGTITLYSPSTATADRSVALSLDALGRQHIPVDGLRAGLWRVRLAWEAAGDTFYRDEAITLR